MWAATAGAGLANIEKSVKDNEIPAVKYNTGFFDDQGHLSIPIVKAVPTRNCLFCHRETDWKKKGTSYTARFDVHLRAEMKCIECHPAGTSAADPRINTFEDHNFGKGDDPGSLVRDDLDNTAVSCRVCHEQGLHRAPIMKHASFQESESFEPHIEALSCQACHVPEKAIKAARVQDSTAFNPLSGTPKLKQIWSFYGPDIKPWNYYGEGKLIKQSDKPLFFYTPQLRRYKNRIYPVSSLYSIWFGLKTDGKPGLDQVFMKDIYTLWTHRDSYPQLKLLADDNSDGFIEINRSEEIDAVISAMTSYLDKKGALKNRRVVFVDGPEVYRSAQKKYGLKHPSHEYSPYGSTFKLSHDIAPAGAALGAGGCSDCHGKDAPFFTAPDMVKPFDASGKPVTAPAYRLLGYSKEELESLLSERN